MINFCPDCARMVARGPVQPPTRQCHPCGGLACEHAVTPHTPDCPVPARDAARSTALARANGC